MEIAELVPELRELLISSRDEILFKDTISGISSKVESLELKAVFENVERDAKDLDGILTANEVNISNALEESLYEGNLESLIKAGGKENVGELNEINTVFKSLTKDIPERKIKLKNDYVKDEINLTKDKIGAEIEEIDKNIDNTVRNDAILKINENTSKFVDYFNVFVKTTKFIIVNGILIALGVSLAEYLKNYKERMSGAFLVSTNTMGDLQYQKIINYSCKHPQNAVILHPFDNEIKAFLNGKSPCENAPDECGGWATVGKFSKLDSIKVNFSKLGKNKTLLCKSATTYEALIDFSKHLGRDISDVVGGGLQELFGQFWEVLRPFAPIASVIFGGFGSFLMYQIMKTSSKPVRIMLPFITFLIISIGLYFLIDSIHISHRG